MEYSIKFIEKFISIEMGKMEDARLVGEYKGMEILLNKFREIDEINKLLRSTSEKNSKNDN